MATCARWVCCQITLLKIKINVTQFKTKPVVGYLLCFSFSFIVVVRNGGIREGQISFEFHFACFFPTSCSNIRQCDFSALSCPASQTDQSDVTFQLSPVRQVKLTSPMAELPGNSLQEEISMNIT